MDQTERDFAQIIGGTFESGGDRSQRYFNAYDKVSRYRAASRLTPRPFGTGPMLDLGCSIGAWHVFWRQHGWDRVVGVDLSHERLNVAHERGLFPVSALAEQLPFPDQSFSFAASIDMLVHVLRKEDRKLVFREMARLLRPGGCFLFTLSLAPGHSMMPGVYRHCVLVSEDEARELATSAGLLIERQIGIQFFPLFRPWRAFDLLPKWMFYTGMATPVDLIFGSTSRINLARVVFYLARKSP